MNLGNKPSQLIPATSQHHKPWHNYSDGQFATPAYTVTPRTEEEAAEAVRFARRNRIQLRVVGGGYSFSPIVQTGGVLVDLKHLTGLTGVDSDRNRVRVRAGTQVKELGGLLWEQGFSMTVQGMFDLQTIVGALSTGTHGTGLNTKCMSSFVTWVKLVNGHGDIIEIDESQARELQAAQTAIGTLGVILEVELQVEPKFYLNQTPTFPGWAEAKSTMSEDLERNLHFALMWFPHDGSPDLYSMPIPDASKQNDLCWRIAFNKDEMDPALDTGERSWESGVMRSYHVFSLDHPQWPKFHEMEYSVPLAAADEAIDAVRDLMKTTDDPQFPLYLRWVKGDDTMLSPFAGRDAVTLSIAGRPDGSYWPYFREYHEILTAFDARGHWGKINFFTRDDVERLYPRHGEFVSVRRELDPDNIFLNDHTRPLFE